MRPGTFWRHVNAIGGTLAMLVLVWLSGISPWWGLAFMLLGFIVGLIGAAIEVDSVLSPEPPAHD